MPIPDEILYDDCWDLDKLDMINMPVGTPTSILGYQATVLQDQLQTGEEAGHSLASPSKRSPASEQSQCGTEQLLLDLLIRTDLEPSSSPDTEELWVIHPPPAPVAPADMSLSSNAAPSSYASPGMKYGVALSCSAQDWQFEPIFK